MLRRFSLLFVGVLATVGVAIRGLETAPALPMSKHWPSTSARQGAAGLIATVGVLLALIWVLMSEPTFVPALWKW